MEQLVTLRQVSKIYNAGELAVTALNSIDLDIEQGAFVSLFGPSGSGKTTLLNLIGALDLPSSGEIVIDGQHLEALTKHQLAEFRHHNLGFIFQSFNLIPVLSAQENVEFVMQLSGVGAKERDQRARRILEEVGLKGMESRRPGELSGGQQQRVAVARAIVNHPKLVLADEPTANLDSKTAASLLDLMREMNEKHGVSFIFSTHDKLVMDRANRLIELRDGKIVSDLRK